MKLEMHKDRLKEVIGVLRNSLSKGSIKPIFEHFLFEIKDKTLTIKATDTKIATLFITTVDNEEDFSFTLLGSTLASLLSSLDGEVVSFEYSSSTNDVKLTCGKYVLDASSGDALEFPAIPIPTDLKEMALPDNFITMVKSVSFSIGADITKRDLNSLCMDVNKDNSGKMSLIATDRIRLSYSASPIEEKDSSRFLIPRSSVAEIEKFEPTHMMYGPEKQRVFFKKETPTGTFILRTVLTNAVYPDIYTYLTEDFGEGKVITLRRRDALRVLKRVRLTSDKQNKSGTVSFNDSQMILTALSASNKSKEEIDIVSPEGTPNSFGINIDYVLDYLNQETLDDVSIRVIENSCLVFDKENHRHVLAVNS